MEENIKATVLAYIKTIGKLMEAERKATENNDSARCRQLEALNYAAQEDLAEVVYRAALWYAQQSEQ